MISFTGADENWILYAQNKTGLLCFIDNSWNRGGDTGYMDGEYEHQHVVVLSVFEVGALKNEKLSSRARIKLHDKPESVDLPEIPVQYLSPIHPTQVGDMAEIVYGEYRGASVRVKDISGMQVMVTVDPTGLLVEVKLDRLCKRVENPS